MKELDQLDRDIWNRSQRATNPTFLAGSIGAGIVAVLFLFPCMGLAQTDWVSGAAASAVIGQEDFESGDANRGGMAAANTLDSPGAIMVDPTSGKVFVCDTWNNRILRFASLAAFKAGTAPESVLGQPNFTLTDSGTTRSRMSKPEGITVDSTGTLWVADYTNHRVLRFDNASSKSIGANADGVLGPSDYTTVNPALSQSDMKFPFDVAVDSNGTLWVSDRGNNRVLRYDNAAGKANGANADGVLGQVDFDSDGTILSAAGLNDPEGMWMANDGDLWVSDAGNHRILRYANAAGKGDGANADGVLGQAGFITNSSATTSFQLKSPSGLMIDSIGDLWVADTDNYRVLRFDNVSGKGDGAPADTVFGQPDFETNNFVNPPTATSLYAPKDLFSDGSDVFISDSNNSRFLVFTKPSPPLPPAPTGVTSTRNSQNFIDVLWNAVTDAANYEVWRGTSLANMVRIGFSSSTTYRDASALTGTDYYYRIVATNVSGSGPQSAATSGKRWGRADMMLRQSGKPIIGKNRYNTYQGQTVKFVGTRRNAVGFVMYTKNNSATGSENFRSYGKKGTAFLDVTYISASHKQNVTAKLIRGKLDRNIAAKKLEKISVRIKPTTRGLNRRCSITVPINTRFLKYPTAKDIGKIILIKKR